MQNPFADYVQRLIALGRQPAVPIPDCLFNDLARHLFRLQHRTVEPYRRFCEARRVDPEQVSAWQMIPAVPTLSFKDLDWTSLAPAERTHRFDSSGTTGGKTSRHWHNLDSLAVYEWSVLPWFQRHLLPEPLPQPSFVALTPSPTQAPHSSLVRMLDAVARSRQPGEFEFAGSIDSGGAWTFDPAKATARLESLAGTPRPIALLGTAFGFVALLDHLTERRVRLTLPPGSRVMETGGYKGRSRALPKAVLEERIEERLGIAASCIVSEYGMTELSSQAYNQIAGDLVPPHSRRFQFPPWARTLIVSPETGLEVGEGESGLLRVFDLANVRSVAAIQTEDLARRCSDGFELLGRGPKSEPRGCSLMQLPAVA